MDDLQNSAVCTLKIAQNNKLRFAPLSGGQSRAGQFPAGGQSAHTTDMLGRPDAKRAPMLPGDLRRMQRAARLDAARAQPSDENTDPRAEAAARPPPRVGSCRAAPAPVREASPRGKHRSGLAPVSENTMDYIGALSWPRAAMHLRKAITFSIKAAEAPKASALFHSWQRTLASVDNVGVDGSPLIELATALDHYRFPFPALPEGVAVRLTRTAIANPTFARKQRTGVSEDAYFAAIAGSWRRSLLSLYGSWRRARVDYFYVLQDDFRVLFVRSAGRSRVYLSHAPSAMLSALAADGIEVVDHDRTNGNDGEGAKRPSLAHNSELVQNGDSEHHGATGHASAIKSDVRLDLDPRAKDLARVTDKISAEEHSDARVSIEAAEILNASGDVGKKRSTLDKIGLDPTCRSDQSDAEHSPDEEDVPGRCETPDVEQIKREIETRAMHAGRREAKVHSAAPTLTSISGNIAAHVLLDWLLNQPDTRASVILPTLISPGPFLGGSLCRTSCSIAGPVANTGELLLHLGGGEDALVLPGAVRAMRCTIEGALGPDLVSVRVQSEDDDTTAAFSRVHKD